MSGSEEKRTTVLGAAAAFVLAMWIAPFALLYVLWRWFVESVWKGNPYP